MPWGHKKSSLRNPKLLWQKPCGPFNTFCPLSYILAHVGEDNKNNFHKVGQSKRAVSRSNFLLRWKTAVKKLQSITALPFSFFPALLPPHLTPGFTDGQTLPSSEGG